ncbi:MAG: hypothetical protein WA941_18400 [Nitrososphaeraceae archaeon]
MAKKEKNLSQEQIKMRILGYLYNRGKSGANSYTIQHRANIPSQEHNRFKGFLEELCTLNCLESYEEETGGEQVRINYRITPTGRTVVDDYRQSSHLSKIFGSIDDLF